MELDITKIKPSAESVAEAAEIAHRCGLRLDANETAAFARQLEYIKAQTYDVLYSKLKAAQFVPIDTSIPEGAETWTFRSWDEAGIAKLIANYADDLPLVDVNAVEETMKLFTAGSAYQWSWLDLKRMAMAPGMNIDTRRAQAARNANERKIDNVFAEGVPNTSTTGFVNNANVPTMTVTNGDWLNPATTADDILDDLFEIEQTVITQSLENHEPDALVLPVAHYGRIATTRLTQGNDLTIKEYFLRNAQSVRAIDRWSKLDTAGPLAKPRGVCYVRSPDVLTAPLPVPFEQLPPEKRNLSYIVACLSRMGGVAFYRPMAAVYADGLSP